ncbi:Unknown protein sequence [Pseudomonas amygdali pv. sesami]|nr:Unknown protein sequence [Pseudomonas amygdali pv. sesami]
MEFREFYMHDIWSCDAGFSRRGVFMRSRRCRNENGLAW